MCCVQYNYTGYSSSNESVFDALILTNTVPMLEPFAKGMCSGYGILASTRQGKYAKNNLTMAKLLVLLVLFSFSVPVCETFENTN